MIIKFGMLVYLHVNLRALFFLYKSQISTFEPAIIRDFYYYDFLSHETFTKARMLKTGYEKILLKLGKICYWARAIITSRRTWSSFFF